MAEVEVSKPLLKLKLLESLRKADFTSLESLVKTQFQPPEDPSVKEVEQLILHYAVQVAPSQLVKDIVERWTGDGGLHLNLNFQDNEGNTPLHLAAYQSRGDVVNLLLSRPGINDCILNNSGLQPIEMCKNLNIAQMMQVKRAEYVAEVAQEFRIAFNNRDFGHLDQIMSNARNAELLDINGTDPESGDTVLHEFVRKKDIEMCRWILGHGGDPFKRDRKGRLPVELLGKVSGTEQTSGKPSVEVELKHLFEKAAREQSVIDVASNLHEPPTYKGYLRKWTNFAQGYRLRWFILGSDGTLSYYKDQADTKNACRGSLNMSTCYLHLDSSEKLKFEIVGGSDGAVRWHLKGNHPVETNKWVWAIQGAIRFAKDREKLMRNANGSTPPGQLLNSSAGHKVGGLNKSMTASNAQAMHSLHTKSGKHQHHRSLSSISSVSSSDYDLNEHLTASGKDYVARVRSRTGNSTAASLRTSVTGGQSARSSLFKGGSGGEEASETGLDPVSDMNKTASDYDEDLKTEYGPHNQELEILQRSISIELASLNELLENSQPSEAAMEAIKKTLTALSQNFNQLNVLSSTRDKKLIKMLTKQRDVNNLWIKSVKDLELELIEKTERLSSLDTERKNLKKLLQRKLLEVSEAGYASENSSGAQDPDHLAQESATTKPLEEIADFIKSNKEKEEDSELDEFFDADDLDDLDREGENESAAQDKRSHGRPQSKDASEQLEVPVANYENQKDEIVKEKDVPSMEISDSTKKDADVEFTEAQKEKREMLLKEGSYLGYEDGVRTKLRISKDNRPKMSLWSVLKSMIGKDMTRMTLPVTFNEPTSLLQRVAEDLEYSNLLDEAATFEDSTLRMLHVAVFSASSYASTIKRVAKPFNPLLGETFEYSRPDMHYRFFTEQVSHHPVISATWTESPKWDFYGESNVDSDFNGRSFDFKHLGLWYLNIRPDSQTESDLYTWKKPNNTVVGILVGNPQVDNYGDVEIVNHTNGDRCCIHFKARGWRSSSAYELKGEVYNGKGGKEWIFGGHWNEAIYAKKVLKPNSSEEMQLEKTKAGIPATARSKTGPQSDGSKFLVWHAHSRPETPFNLTQFAITLNAPQPKLLPWIAPTDTRHRPDQRAMEEGRYDEAGDEKHRVEQKQRKARRERELNHEEYKPKWFKQETHPVTKLKYWKYQGEYWKRRKDHKLGDCPDIF
ncbi:LAMI_0E15874g1_1 [Lachancea mirantina]|uniref:LAMI_0E15874g1_1 n=1 Tax=Lachancea mirantina TaxID=1230905 RepID=A0A1G4JT23_9SACH|nr:LAMI_0E15874g1_1 [Lachancea mirantina]